jgi:hypothetical protein
VRGLATALILLLVAFPTAAQDQDDAPPGEEQARTAALAFGRALTNADASLLKPLLPRRGKVRLRLVRFGPEDGSYSAGQVVVLFDDFLQQGSVGSFTVLRAEGGHPGYALAHGRAGLTDPEGRSCRVDLHLTFQPEGGHWVLREIRESSP